MIVRSFSGEVRFGGADSSAEVDDGLPRAT